MTRQVSPAARWFAVVARLVLVAVQLATVAGWVAPIAALAQQCQAAPVAVWGLTRHPVEALLLVGHIVS